MKEIKDISCVTGGVAGATYFLLSPVGIDLWTAKLKIGDGIWEVNMEDAWGDSNNVATSETLAGITKSVRAVGAIIIYPDYCPTGCGVVEYPIWQYGCCGEPQYKCNTGSCN